MQFSRLQLIYVFERRKHLIRFLTSPPLEPKTQFCFEIKTFINMLKVTISQTNKKSQMWLGCCH